MVAKLGRVAQEHPPQREPRRLSAGRGFRHVIHPPHPTARDSSSRVIADMTSVELASAWLTPPRNSIYFLQMAAPSGGLHLDSWRADSPAHELLL